MVINSQIIKLITVLLLSVGSIQAQNLTTKQSSKIRNHETAKLKVFMILDITVHDTAMYEQYRINVEKVIKDFGGKYIVRSGGISFDNDPDTKLIPVEGNWNPDRLIIVQWDSIEQLQKFSKSDEYLKIVQLRTNSASTKAIIVKEYLKK